MKQQNKFTTGQEQTSQNRAANSGELNFENAEDLLRHDAAQTLVPPDIARRLSESIAQEPAPRQSWWRKLLS
ncbi:MAG TPA: hypothetical protein VGO59_09600 [Verrucomicrobiae bacterium]|jgi:negative regulator of sigma E activity